MVTRRIKKLIAWVLAIVVVVWIGAGVWWLATAI
jgi:hypothetical protein